jgi:hypothetical protein
VGALLNINHRPGILFYQKPLSKWNSHFTAYTVDFDKSIKNKEMKPDTFHSPLTPVTCRENSELAWSLCLCPSVNLQRGCASLE